MNIDWTLVLLAFLGSAGLWLMALWVVWQDKKRKPA